MRFRRVFIVISIVSVLFAGVLASAATAGTGGVSVKSEMRGQVPDTCMPYNNLGNGSHSYPVSGSFTFSRAAAANTDGSYNATAVIVEANISTGSKVQVGHQTIVDSHGFAGCEPTVDRSAVVHNGYHGKMRVIIKFKYTPPAAGDFTRDNISLFVNINGIPQNGFVSHEFDPMTGQMVS